MGILGPVEHDVGILVQQAQERAQQDEFLRTLASDPAGAAHLADLISQWGDHAPTLPPGAIYGLASSGVGPMGPMGPTIIKNAVPAMHQPPDAVQNAMNSIDMSNLAQPSGAQIGQSPTSGLGKPLNLDGGGGGVLGSIESGLGTAAGAVGHGLSAAASGITSGLQAADRPFQSAATGGNPQEAGFGNAEGAKAVAREAGVVGNTGLQALEATARLGQGAITMAHEGSIGGNYPTLGGGTMHVGTAAQLFDPHQLTAYNQAMGQSVGTGILPGGQASATATAAAQRAANINGHALTVGRALASTVFEPGSRPFQVMSGLSDAYTALNLDPMANALKFGSEARAANAVFAPLDDRTATSVAQYLVDNANTSDAMTALHQWAGSPESDLVGTIADKIKKEPGSAKTIADQLEIGTDKGLMRAAVAHKIGAFSGLRPFVHPPTAIQWMASKEGSGAIDALAGETSFTKIRQMLGDTVPVDLVARLAHADTPEMVRSVIGAELGPTVDGPFGYRWFRPPESVRLFGQMPKGSIDSYDGNQMIQQAERTLNMAKIPTDLQDPVLEEIAGARTPGAAVKAYFKVGDVIAEKMAGVPTRYVQYTGQDGNPILQREIETAAGVPSQLVQIRRAQEASTGVSDAKRVIQYEGGDGVPPVPAKKLTHFFQNEWEQQHQFNVDGVGQAVRAAGMTVDGESVPIWGPFSESELARFIPPLDYRALRQATSKSRQLLHFWNDGYLTGPDEFAGGVARRLHQAASVENWVSGKVTGLFKAGVLSAPRVPLRIAGEEQLASASAGVDSLFRHPISYIATALAGRAGEPTSLFGKAVEKVAQGAAGIIGEKAAINPLTGKTFADELATQGETIAKAMGRAAANNPSPWKIDQQMLKAYVSFSKDDAPYLRSWADEISLLHKSPLDREVARALADSTHVPAGLEDSGLQGLPAVKEWFSNGHGLSSLANLRDADLSWGSKYLNNRGFADQYVDQIRDRVMTKTGGDPTLIDAAANGTGFNFSRANQGIGQSVSHDLRQYLSAHKDDLGPDVVKGRPPIGTAERYSLDHAVDWFFGKLMDTPGRILTKSPFYRQWSYKETQRLMPYLTSEAQDFALSNAASDGMTLTRGTTSGLLSAEDADTIVKARTLARMKDYLYYPGDKTTAEDILRNVSPFAPAWKSVIKRWSKLSIENLGVPERRLQQGVQEMQQSGFTYKDPQTGKEVFTIAGPEWVKALTGATGFSLEGPVQGLNIVGNGLPGVGLGPQIAAATVIPKNGMTAAVRNFISPYGDPDFSGWQDMFFPGWLQKMQAGQFQGLGLLSGPLSTIIPRTPKQNVTVQDLQKQALTTMVLSGQYDLSKPGVLDQLEARAIHQANSLYMWRGLAQFMAPTAPTYNATVPDLSTGTGILLYKATQMYHTLLVANKYDYQKTDDAFVKVLGPNFVFATEPENLRTVYGIPTSIQGEVWQQQHQQFVDRYKNVWGYFAPQGGTFSQTVYQDQIAKGLIQPLKLSDWSSLAESQIGTNIYDQLRKQFGGHVNRAQQNWLDTQKALIAKQHPGYTANIPDVATKARYAQIITEMGNAVEDPLIAQTPVAKAVKIYLGLREDALKAAGRKTMTGANMAASRAWLYENGNELVRQYPELSPIWDSLFQREVVP